MSTDYETEVCTLCGSSWGLDENGKCLNPECPANPCYQIDCYGNDDISNELSYVAEGHIYFDGYGDMFLRLTDATRWFNEMGVDYVPVTDGTLLFPQADGTTHEVKPRTLARVGLAYSVRDLLPESPDPADAIDPDEDRRARFPPTHRP